MTTQHLKNTSYIPGFGTAEMKAHAINCQGTKPFIVYKSIAQTTHDRITTLHSAIIHEHIKDNRLNLELQSV